MDGEGFSGRPASQPPASPFCALPFSLSLHKGKEEKGGIVVVHEGLQQPTFPSPLPAIASSINLAHAMPSPLSLSQPLTPYNM